MSDSGFGLAPVKREGWSTNLVTGEVLKGNTGTHSGDRYIGLRYLPRDDYPADTVRLAVQDYISSNNLNEDEIYTLIANILNEFIEDGGF